MWLTNMVTDVQPLCPPPPDQVLEEDVASLRQEIETYLEDLEWQRDLWRERFWVAFGALLVITALCGWMAGGLEWMK